MIKLAFIGYLKNLIKNPSSSSSDADKLALKNATNKRY